MAKTIKNFEPSRAAVFIDALHESGRVRLACIAAGVSLRVASDWRDTRADFKSAWDDALAARLHLLEDEATRRAVEGVERPVYQTGRLVGTVREYSDSLLALMLRAADPVRYGNRVDVTSGGVPITLDEGARAARVAQLLALAQQRQALPVPQPAPDPCALGDTAGGIASDLAGLV